MKISHISVSRKGIWEECQQKYKFRYELQTVVDQEEPEDQFAEPVPVGNPYCANDSACCSDFDLYPLPFDLTPFLDFSFGEM